MGEHAHADVTGLSLEKGRLSSKLVLRLADGSQAGMETPKGLTAGDVDEFLAAAAGAGAPQT